MPRRCDTDTLLVRWDKVTREIRAFFPNQADVLLVMGALFKTPPAAKRSLIAELDARGYDPTTLRFVIKRKANQSEQGPDPESSVEGET